MTTTSETTGEIRAETSYKLISEEINTILAEILGKFLVAGNPTKHGGLRFLDIESAKTFGFERADVLEGTGNLFIISAPVDVKFDERDIVNVRLTYHERQTKIEELKTAARERIEIAIKTGPHADRLHQVLVRTSPDPGKQKKLFVEVRYIIPTGELISDENVIRYAQAHGQISTNEAVRRILREYVGPVAKECMDHLVGIIRKE